MLMMFEGCLHPRRTFGSDPHQEILDHQSELVQRRQVTLDEGPAHPLGSIPRAPFPPD